MIEVNLLPGGKKRGAGGGFSLKNLSLPSLGSLGGGAGGRDNYQLFCIAAVVIAVGFVGFSFLSLRSATEDLQVQLEQQIQDSIQFNSIIQQTTQLRERSDSIAARVQIIQDIDADRFVWPHVLDEVAIAVPDYTWLREVMYQGDNPVTIRVSGRAGSYFAMTQFWERLEVSRFLQGVDLVTSSSVPSEANPEDLVVEFELVMSYVAPPLEELETTPLFGESSAMQAAPPPGN